MSKLKKVKTCCKKQNRYYQGDYEFCLNCKYKKKMKWDGQAVTYVNRKPVY